MLKHTFSLECRFTPWQKRNPYTIQRDFNFLSYSKLALIHKICRCSSYRKNCRFNDFTKTHIKISLGVSVFSCRMLVKIELKRAGGFFSEAFRGNFLIFN